MNRQRLIVVLAGLTAVASLAACAHRPTELERNFGASVRNMIEAQTYDPSTLASPSTETIETGDGQRLGNALGVYRSDVGQPDSVRQDLDISVDGGR